MNRKSGQINILGTSVLISIKRQKKQQQKFHCVSKALTEVNITMYTTEMAIVLRLIIEGYYQEMALLTRKATVYTLGQ